MSVLIKGMEMPQNCYWCPLRASCVFRIYLEERPYDCPLIPVPDHGRLIDADALHYSRVAIWHNDSTMPMGGYVGGMNAVVMSAEINNAPTIIPAEEADHA